MKQSLRKLMKQEKQASATSEDQYLDRVTDACLYGLVAFGVIGVLSAIIFSFLS